MTLEEFVKAYTGQTVDTDGVYPNQCMDLMHTYVYKVLGLTDKFLLAAPSAAQVYTNFKPEWGQFFTKIDNTPTAVPLAGDILFFGTQVGPYGHVCIFQSGDADTFKSFDANWPIGSLPHIQDHNYNGVLGWLHPKSQSNTYKGIDLNNVDSVKAAIDTWSDVVSGVYVRKSEYDLAITANEGLKDSLDKVEADLATTQNALEGAQKAAKPLEEEVMRLKDQLASQVPSTDSQQILARLALLNGLELRLVKLS